MKRKEGYEPDLYVVNRRLTEEEEKEVSLYIEKYKRTHKMESPQKYKAIPDNMQQVKEPETTYAKKRKAKASGKKKPKK